MKHVFIEGLLSSTRGPRTGASAGKETHFPCLQVTVSSSSIKKEMAGMCDELAEKESQGLPERKWEARPSLPGRGSLAKHCKQEPLLLGCQGRVGFGQTGGNSIGGTGTSMSKIRTNRGLEPSKWELEGEHSCISITAQNRKKEKVETNSITFAPLTSSC